MSTPTAPPEFALRNFDLNLLKVFDEVMAERSLTRAAQRLSLTQPAVSNALRRLREALGDDLLVRKSRGLEPTPRALALWPGVREALQSLQASLSPQRFDPSRAERVFVLAMADATAAELMPPLLRSLQSSGPGLGLRVVPLTTRDPRPLLDAGDAELAVGHFPAVRSDLTARAQAGMAVAFRHQRLFSGDYVCVMRRGHALAAQPLTLENFCAARHLLVSLSGRAWGFIDEALHGLGRQRRVVLTVNQFFTAAAVVLESDLLTVLPRHFIPLTGFADQLLAQPLPFAVAPIQVDALWHERLHHDEAQQWLRDQWVRAGAAVGAAVGAGAVA